MSEGREARPRIGQVCDPTHRVMHYNPPSPAWKAISVAPFGELSVEKKNPHPPGKKDREVFS